MALHSVRARGDGGRVAEAGVAEPEQTVGVNGLIRDGQAKLITCMDDVLDELADVGEIMRKDTSDPTQSRPGSQNGVGEASASLRSRLGSHERTVLDAIVNGAEDTDRIIATTPLETARVMSALTSLQIKGLIRQLPGGLFAPRS